VLLSWRCHKINALLLRCSYDDSSKVRSIIQSAHPAALCFGERSNRQRKCPCLEQTVASTPSWSTQQQPEDVFFLRERDNAWRTQPVRQNMWPHTEYVASTGVCDIARSAQPCQEDVPAHTPLDCMITHEVCCNAQGTWLPQRNMWPHPEYAALSRVRSCLYSAAERAAMHGGHDLAPRTW